MIVNHGPFGVVRRLVLIASAFMALAALTACNAESRLVARTAGGDRVFTVEVVDTPETTSRGLMFREHLAPDAGMLFDFKAERDVSFWMVNTLIPLDMIFIAANGEVKSIHANARPLDPTSIPSGFPVRFVLEIPGGRAAEIGLVAGDRIEHPRMR